MLSVQEVGTQILTGNPGKFYIFLGEEYGIKEKYLDNIKKHYQGEFVEMQTVSEVLSIMNRKQLIPLTPKLYIIRYDESYISSISDKSSSEILTSNIIGTIVCIYEDSKHCAKIEKYLSDYAVRIDKVSPQFVEKYLHSDFPNVSDRLIKLCVMYSQNYSQAKNMCRSISSDVSAVSDLSDEEISQLFGTTTLSSDSQIRLGVASRNFKYMMNVIDTYDAQYDSALYTMLSTTLEIEKLLLNKRAQSDIREYVNRWTLEDVYYFFNHVYSELKKLRSIASNGKLSLIYLSSLLVFQRIPRQEDIL